jgi:hypothetical protein
MWVVIMMFRTCTPKLLHKILNCISTLAHDTRAREDQTCLGRQVSLRRQWRSHVFVGDGDEVLWRCPLPVYKLAPLIRSTSNSVPPSQPDLP